MVQDVITKFYTLIKADRLHKYVAYDVTICFRLAFIEVLKAAENAASDGFVRVKYIMQCCLMQCQRRLQISRVRNIGNV